MARLSPEFPRFKSRGEEALAGQLRRLPDDCVLYHEPRYHASWPDFVVISPRFGILVLESKGWTPGQIGDADRYRIKVNYQGKPMVCQHPIEQVRAYRENLQNFCRTHSRLQTLVGDNGRLRFPMGHAVVLNRMQREQLHGHGLAEIFREEETVTADVLERWTAETDPNALERALFGYMTVRFAFSALSEAEMQALRMAINPSREIRQAEFDFNGTPTARPTPTESSQVLRYLDDRQESAALGLGAGHRILSGVAGSGKTLILHARARYLAQVAPESRVLLLCYNRALAAHLQFQLREVKRNVDVMSFHSFAWRHGVRERLDDEVLGEALKSRLEVAPPNYDAVLIDEGQDFPSSWFECAVAALKDRDNGDLVVATDGAQGLYKRRGFTWSSVNIQARGRVETQRFGLDRNYRNTRRILRAAACFAEPCDGIGDSESSLSLAVDPGRSIAAEGVPPEIWCGTDRVAETRFAYLTVKRALEGRWNGTPIEPLRPEEVAIFYPPLPNAGDGTDGESGRDVPDGGCKTLRPLLRQLVDALSGLAPTYWLTDPERTAGPNPRDAVAKPGIKVQTIHSAKGLQYRAVILLWSDLLPSTFSNALHEANDRKLMYVALTRAESLLLLTHSRPSPFLQEVAEAAAECALAN